MKFLKISAPVLSATLLLVGAIPTFAGEPTPTTKADLQAIVVAAGNSVDMSVNVNAEKSNITVLHGDLNKTTVNGMADSVTNVLSGPNTTINVNQSTNINGFSDSNLSVGGGPGSKINVSQGNSSQTTINGGANSALTVNAGTDYTVNLNGTNIQQQIFQAGYRAPDFGWEWNWTYQRMNKLVLPALDNLTKNTDLLTKAVARLITDGKAEANDLKVLKESLENIQTDTANIRQQLQLLQATSAAVDGTLVAQIDAVQNLAGEQAKVIDLLTARIGDIEYKQYVMEHSGPAYQVQSVSNTLSDNVRNFFNAVPDKFRGFFTSITDNVKKLTWSPVKTRG